MSNQEAFNQNGKVIILTRNYGECREHFLTRSHFVLRNLEKYDSIKTLVNKSYLYLNKYILGQTFDKEIENELNDGFNCDVI